MHFLKLDTSFTSDFYEIGRYKLVWRLCFIFSIVFGTLATIFSQIDQVTFVIYAIVCGLSGGSLIYVHSTKKWRTIFWVITISATVLVSISLNLNRDTMHYSEVLWMMCIVLFAYIGLSPKIAMGFAIVNALSVCYYVTFNLNDYIQQITPVTWLGALGICIEIIFIFFITTYLIQQNIKYQNYAQKELKKSNTKLEAQNRENILLLKEVHHRVKNNLQIVVSLLRIQESDISSNETKAHFNDAINRVMTISLIHQKLYELGELSSIEFKDYIKELVTEIKSLHVCPKPVEKVFFINVESLDLKSVVPIGLILNELITNSIKHAFDTTEHPQINIELYNTTDDKVVLLYTDNGNWKDSKKPGFGTELIQTLADQIDGKLTREKSVYIIIFPKQIKEA